MVDGSGGHPTATTARARSTLLGWTAAAALLLVGCTNNAPSTTDDTTTERHEQPQEPDETATDPRVRDGIFYGTAVEYSRLKQECFRRLGAAVEPDATDPTRFSTNIQDIEVIRDLEQQCQKQIGRFEPDALPEDYLRRIYDHALWQRDCLIERGYDLPTPPTWEHFLEHRDFSPLAQVNSSTAEWQQLAADCPRLHVWEQQQGLLD